MSSIVPGMIIAQRYRLDHVLGAGGMGSVWAAVHLELGSPVAIKLLHAGLNDHGMHQRFVAEAKAAAGLRSPHVVQILDHGFDQGVPFIVMEKLEGQSLGERLRDHGRLAFSETLTILSHVTRAISRAHEAGIVHRDLKPDNIFLHRNDDEFVAKVLDFGIAKIQADSLTNVSPNTHTGMLLGSPFFMSPEQAEGRRDVDWRTDLWALGVIVYECLTGHNPYTEETLGRILVKIIKEDVPAPSTLAPVPAGFDAWFARANRKDKAERFQSAKEMTEALRQLQGQALVSSLPGAVAASTAPGDVPVPAGTTTMGVSANSVAGKTPSSTSGGRYVLFGAAALVLLGAGGWLLSHGASNAKSVEVEPAAAAGVEPTPALGAANAPMPAAATPDNAAPEPAPAASSSPPVAVPPPPSVAPSPKKSAGQTPTVVGAKKSLAAADATKPSKPAAAAQPAPSPPAAAPAAPFNPLQQRF
jgi:eukaryotic-like serine/threonine-protein kinase